MIKCSAPVVTTMAVLSFAALVGGCGADDEPQAHATDSSMPTLDPTDLPKGPKLEHAQNAVGDIIVTDCGNGAGPVEATGYVRNSSKARADYVIRVSWVTSQGAMVAHSLATAKRVAPGAKATWTAATTLTDDNKYACSTSIERGTLAQ